MRFNKVINSHKFLIAETRLAWIFKNELKIISEAETHTGHVKELE